LRGAQRRGNIRAGRGPICHPDPDENREKGIGEVRMPYKNSRDSLLEAENDNKKKSSPAKY